MKINILNEKEMRQIGFTDYRKEYWHLCRDIFDEITFNLTISKDGKQFKINVLDEDFCQPYDYQYILHNDPHFQYALRCKEKVEGIMLDLVDKGIVSEYEVGEYI